MAMENHHCSTGKSWKWVMFSSQVESEDGIHSAVIADIKVHPTVRMLRGLLCPTADTA
jgi:hypothetical protein